MAEAYPAFDLKNNRTPGSGSGPMGGPGPFAPSNTPIVYARGSDPVQAFMANLSAAGVAGINSEGIPVGSTGGTTFMWSDQVKAANEAAGGDVMGSMGRMNNQFLQPRQAQQPAPMAGNAFLNPTTDVRINGLTPATLAPGGTPMLGRDYGSVNAAQKAPNAGFGLLAREISLADGPVARNGALFEYGGAGKGFSITQDPNTIPAQGSPSATAGFSPDAAAIAYTGLSSGMDRNAFLTNLTAGKFDPAVPTNVVLSPLEQAAKARENAQLREQALVAFDRVANSGVAKTAGQDSGVRQNRDNVFMSMLGLDQQQLAATGATVNKRVAAANKVREEGKEREMAPTELFKLYQERKAFQEAGNDAMVKTYDQRIEKMVTSSGVADFFKAMAEMGGKGGTAAVNAPVPAPEADIPTLTPEEAAKLKPGTKFKTTNGDIRIRQ